MINFRSKQKTLLFALLLLITLFAIFIHGYTFSEGDQSFHLPFLYKAIDSNSFKHDYLFLRPEEDSLQFTWFYKIMAGIIRATQIDLQWLYLALYIIVRFLLTLRFFKLAFTLLKDEKKSLLATVFLSVPLPIGGTATTTFDTAFVPRFFIVPLVVLAFNRILTGNYYLASLLIGLIFLIHPFSAVILGIALGGVIVFERKPINVLLKSAVISFTISSPFILGRLPVFLSHTSSLVMSPEWVNILQTRTPYLFLSKWSYLEWLSLIVFSMATFLMTRHNRPQSSINKRVRYILITLLITTSVYFVFSEVVPIAPIVQLQILRMWIFPVVLAPILAILTVFGWLKTLNPKLKLYTTVFLLCLFIVFRIRSIRTDLPNVELPHQQHRDWDKAQIWINENTPKDAVILSPPHRAGFRIHSQRTIVAEIKDGSSGIYSFSFAREWHKRISELHPLPPKTTPEIIKLKQKYNADYFVTFIDTPRPKLKELYRNHTFIVYSL